MRAERNGGERIYVNTHISDRVAAGFQYASQLGATIPPGTQVELEKLTAEIANWREDVLKLAADAACALDTPMLSSNGFLSDSSTPTGGSSAEMRSRDARFRLKAAESQLNASRERSQAASEKLREVTGHIGDILAEVASIDIQKRNVSINLESACAVRISAA